MIRVGITGQSGFIGTHLFNYLSIKNNKFKLIPFYDDFFSDEKKLRDFCSNCDVIIHLAALNRHNNPTEIYNTNLILVEKLIFSLNQLKSKAHIIFASSIQEERENEYGRSKREGRLKLAQWAKNNKSGFTGLIIPNVYGPFGRPFYNSVISTFSYQLCNNETPKIEIDLELKLIYVGELVQLIEKIISENINSFQDFYIVPHTYLINVTGILDKLKKYQSLYLNSGILPELNNPFDINLFNTFRSYINLEKFFPYRYKLNADSRGIFVEIIKLYSGGQVSFSTTLPGITRGNHFHTRKIERFAVIKGEAVIRLRKFRTAKVSEFKLSGTEPAFIDMPIWYTHNITNIGNSELVTIFWINEFFNPDDPDTFSETV